MSFALNKNSVLQCFKCSEMRNEIVIFDFYLGQPHWHTYRIAGIFRGGVIFVFFAVVWNPQKINPRKFVFTGMNLQTVLFIKHISATTTQKLNATSFKQIRSVLESLRDGTRDWYQETMLTPAEQRFSRDTHFLECVDWYLENVLQ